MVCITQAVINHILASFFFFLDSVNLVNIKSNFLTNSSMSAGLLGRVLAAPLVLDAVLALGGECFLDDDLLCALGRKNDFIFFLGLTIKSGRIKIQLS